MFLGDCSMLDSGTKILSIARTRLKHKSTLDAGMVQYSSTVKCYGHYGVLEYDTKILKTWDWPQLATDTESNN